MKIIHILSLLVIGLFVISGCNTGQGGSPGDLGTAPTGPAIDPFIMERLAALEEEIDELPEVPVPEVVEEEPTYACDPCEPCPGPDIEPEPVPADEAKLNELNRKLSDKLNQCDPCYPCGGVPPLEEQVDDLERRLREAQENNRVSEPVDDQGNSIRGEGAGAVPVEGS